MMYFLGLAIAFIATIVAVVRHEAGEKNEDGLPETTFAPVTTLPTPSPEPAPYARITRLEAIYDEAKDNLGRRLTLNPSVPPEVGCVQAVSYVLWHCGYPIPTIGLNTVNRLIQWLLEHGFKEVTSHTPGAIITAHHPNASDPTLAHAGICGETHVMSNTSYSDPTKGLVAGLWQANYSHASWDSFYRMRGLTTRYFVPGDNSQ